MDQLRDRLTAANSQTETNGEPTDERSSGTVEWRDISIETNGPTGWASGPGPDNRGHSASTDPFETLDTDQLVGGVLDAVDSPALVVDRRGKTVSINTAACEVFGTTQSAALGARPTVVHGGQPLSATVLATGDEIRNQREAISIDGEKRTVSRTLTPLRDHSGEVVGATETLSTDDPHADSHE